MDGGAWKAASPWRRWGSDTTERLHFHFSLSCIGEGNGNPLQCSCLENPRDGEAWWAAVYGVAQSRTLLKRLSSKAYWSYPWAVIGWLEKPDILWPLLVLQLPLSQGSPVCTLPRRFLGYSGVKGVYAMCRFLGGGHLKIEVEWNFSVSGVQKSDSVLRIYIIYMYVLSQILFH